MLFFKRKSFRFITILLLTTLTISFLFVAFIGAFQSIRNKALDNKVFVFGASPITEVDYKKYSTYEINSAEGYMAFVESTRDKSSKDSKIRTMSSSKSALNGANYDGKTIIQTDDIDLTGFSNIQMHGCRATWKGNGHVIKLPFNAYVLSKRMQEETEITPLTGGVRGNAYYSILGEDCYVDYIHTIFDFAEFNHEDYNLDETLHVNVTYHFGGLFDTFYGNMEECVIRNPYFGIKRCEDGNYNFIFSTIANTNEGTIKNCLIEGDGYLKWLIGGDYAFSGVNGAPEYGLVMNKFCEVNNGTISKTIFGANISVEDNSSNKKGVGDNPGNCTNAFSDAYNDSSYNSSNSVDSGSVWYKFTSGFGFCGQNDYRSIYPRFAIEWKTYKFNIDPTEAGTLSRKSLTVPKNCDAVFRNGSQVTIYGQTITATLNDGYKFLDRGSASYSYWDLTIGSNSNEYILTALATLDEVLLSFWDVDEAEPCGNPNIAKLIYGVAGSNSYSAGTDLLEFNVRGGSIVKIEFLSTHSQCDYKITKPNCCAVVRVSFTGKLVTGASVESTSQNYEVLFIITSPSYYISKCADEYSNNINLTLTEDTPLYVDFKSKTYKVEFK